MMIRRLLRSLLCVAALAGVAPLAHATNVIQSINHCAIAIAGGTTSATCTIPTVVVANTILIYDGTTTGTTSTSGYTNVIASVALTNATTVTATRGSAGVGTNPNVVKVEVIEFSGHVNSIQAGTIAITTGNVSNTATISTVGANAFVLFEGAQTGSTLGATQAGATVALTNTTTVRATIGAALGATITVGYMAVDLDSTIISTVEQRAHTDATAATSYSDTLATTVTPGNTLVLFNGITMAATTTIGQVAHVVYLANGSTVTMTRNGSNTASRTVAYTVVQFQGAVLNGNVQRAAVGQIAVAAATTGTAAISSVDTTASIVNWNNFLTANGTPNATSANLALTNAATVTATLNAAGSPQVPYEVLQFATGGGGATVPRQTLLGVGLLDRDDDEPSL